MVSKNVIALLVHYQLAQYGSSHKTIVTGICDNNYKGELERRVLNGNHFLCFGKHALQNLKALLNVQDLRFG